MIENRNLEVGTKLTATYEKQAHVCTVEPGEEEGTIAFVLEDGKRFKSPSAAAVAITGVAQNGWRFWSLEGDAKAASEDPASPKPAKAKKGSGKKTIRRIPRPADTGDDQSRWFCSACMKAFTIDGNDAPAACPENHPMEDLNSEAVAS